MFWRKHNWSHIYMIYKTLNFFNNMTYVVYWSHISKGAQSSKILNFPDVDLFRHVSDIWPMSAFSSAVTCRMPLFLRRIYEYASSVLVSRIPFDSDTCYKGHNVTQRIMRTFHVNFRQNKFCEANYSDSAGLARSQLERVCIGDVTFSITMRSKITSQSWRQCIFYITFKSCNIFLCLHNGNYNQFLG